MAAAISSAPYHRFPLAGEAKDPASTTRDKCCQVAGRALVAFVAISGVALMIVGLKIESTPCTLIGLLVTFAPIAGACVVRHGALQSMSHLPR